MGLLVAIDVYRAGVLQQHYDFSSDAQRLLRVGKLASAQVRLDEPAASRIHAIIELSPTQAMLVDMGAESGTHLNGKRVSKVKLSHGDQITVGETVLVVSLGATAAAGVPASPASRHPAAAPVPPLPPGPARGPMAPPSMAPGVPPYPGPSAFGAPGGYPAPSQPTAPAPMGAPPLGSVASAPMPAQAFGPAGARPVAASAPPLPSGPSGARVPVQPAQPQAAAAPAPQPFGAPGPAFAQPQPVAASAPPPFAPPAAVAPAGPVGQAAWTPPAQRIAAKLAVLGPEALAEAERYVDWLAARQHDPNAASTGDTELGSDGPAAGGVARRDTVSMIQEMRRDRRVKQLAIAGGMAAILVVLLVLVLRAPRQDAAEATGAVAQGAGATAPGATAVASPTPADAAAGSPAAAPQPPPAPDATSLVYRVPRDMTVREVATELWQRPEAADHLLRANPTLTSADAIVAHDTWLRVPRAITYRVEPGDTLAAIAQRMLGRMDAYTVIEDANEDVLPDADSLEAGMSLSIPLVSPDLDRKLTAAYAAATAGPSASAPAIPGAPPAPAP